MKAIRLTKPVNERFHKWNIMSTIEFAQLTNALEASTPGKSTGAENPGMRTYVDALAALVPAEVLTLHALIISTTTVTTQTKKGIDGAVYTTILPDAIFTLKFAFWALVLISMALFAFPRYFGGKWDKLDWVRILIAPLAFVGWTMLQRTTAFDAAFPGMNPFSRTVAALFLGAVLGAVAAALAMKADAKPIV